LPGGSAAADGSLAESIEGAVAAAAGKANINIKPKIAALRII
jgi:hypothetical protein